MREEFEAWAKLRRYSLICEDDEYLQRETKIAWSAWQGAVAWEREECAKIADADWAWADCAKAIRARGEK